MKDFNEFYLDEGKVVSVVDASWSDGRLTYKYKFDVGVNQPKVQSKQRGDMMDKKPTKAEAEKYIKSQLGKDVKVNYTEGHKKDFKSFLEAEDLEYHDADSRELDDDYDEVFDSAELSEKMWNFIMSLTDAQLDSLDDNQIDDYLDIVEEVAGEDEDDDEDMEEASDAKKILSKYQFKDAFTLSDDEAKDLVKNGLIKANAGRGTYSITDKGKDFLESAELTEALPKKRVRRDVQARRKSARAHRKVKAKRKIQGRRRRKTAKFKRFKKKSKRMAKRGLTSTGKRKRTFINK